jgi:hypothetical protein
MPNSKPKNPNPEVVLQDDALELFPIHDTENSVVSDNAETQDVGNEATPTDETSEDVPESVDEADNSSKRNRWRGLVAVGAATAVLVGGLAMRGCGSEDNNDPRTKGGVEMCDDYINDHAANNSDEYVSTAFLPKGEIKDSEGSKKTVESWFNEDGPLAGKGDFESIALVMAAIAQPAEQGEITNPNYSYTAAYERNIARYNGDNGVEAARNDCRKAWDVLGQVAGYDEQALKKGVTVSQFTASRDKETNNITGLTLTKYVPTEYIEGTVFKLRNTSKLNAFYEIVVDQNGNMFVSGYTEAPTQPKDGDIDAGVNPADTDVTIDVAPQPDPNADNSANTDTAGPGPSGPGPSGPGPSGPGPSGPGPSGPGPSGPGPSGPGPSNPGPSNPGPTPTTPQTTPTTTRPPVPTVPPTTAPFKPPMDCDPAIDVC